MKTLVTSYVNPDLDGYGGSYAYAELLRAQGVDAVAAFSGTPLPEVAHVLERFGIAPVGAPDFERAGRIVVVDAHDPNILDPRLPLDRVVEIIDHHEAGDAASFPNAAMQNEIVGAAATLVAERCRASGEALSREAALLLLGGIVSNSLNFQSSQTSDRDRAMAAWLTEVSAAPADFAHALLAAKSDLRGGRLALQLEADSAPKHAGGLHIHICQLELIGTEALLAERGDELRAVLRELRAAEKADRIFLILVDLESDHSILVADDPEMQALLSSALPVRFEGAVARHEGRILRKQVWPLLKARLEG